MGGAARLGVLHAPRVGRHAGGGGLHCRFFAAITGPLLRSPEEGADTAVWLAATNPAPPTGRFFHDRRPRPEHYLPFTRETDRDRQSMWRYCADAIRLENP